MEFLKVYDVSDIVFKNIESLLGYKDSDCIKVFIQKDVHDYHVFRILEGINNEYERECGVYLLEYDKINTFDVREGSSPRRTALNVLRVDSNRMENFTTEEFYDLEQAVDRVKYDDVIEVI